jgi:hypothetical protein
MSGNHPAFPGMASVFQVMEQLRKTFPNEISADTLKKWGMAPANEGRLLAVLKFLKVIDDTGKKTEAAGKLFSIHDKKDFETAFGKVVKSAYTDLFSTFGEDAWKLDTNKLIGYFRQNDQTSALVGQRQAYVFQALAALSGHEEIPTSGSQKNGKSKERKPKIDKPSPKEVKIKPTAAEPFAHTIPPSQKKHDMGLTVRIEINLPAGGDQETYDRIFASIRRNLINGE